jgi:hypothetical protein
MDIINRTLTQPRPNPAMGGFGQQGSMGSFGQQGNMGAFGQQGNMGVAGQQGNMAGMGGMGPGMAGIASKYEGASIRVYNERKKYQEWEFVYDASKDPALNPQMNQQQGAGLKNSVTNPGFGSFNSNNNSSNSSSNFGSGSSFGSGSGSSFGSSSSISQPTPDPNKP